MSNQQNTPRSAIITLYLLILGVMLLLNGVVLSQVFHLPTMLTNIAGGIAAVIGLITGIWQAASGPIDKLLGQFKGGELLRAVIFNLIVVAGITVLIVRVFSPTTLLTAQSSSTPPVTQSALPTSTPTAGPQNGTSYSEQEGHLGANTFTDPYNAAGIGPDKILPGAPVQVTCKVYAPSIPSVKPDGYWYRIASNPWNNAYYAPANTFLNGDPWGGPYTHNTDFSVPDCKPQ